MKYLVTGGAGFIGSHLADRLLQDDGSVILLDNFYYKNRGNIAHLKDKNGLTVYNRDICGNLDDVFQAHKIDVVFHLAAIPRVQFSIKNPQETHDVNVNGTVNLLEACRKSGVKRFVFSSSSSVYGDQPTLPLSEGMMPNPMSPYAFHKLIGEHYCKMYHDLYGMETISLRYFNVYGPRQDPGGDYACLIPKFIKLIKEGRQPTIYGDGEQTRDFVFVSDVVSANLAAAETENKGCFAQAFNIGEGKNRSVNQVTDKILRLARSKIEPVHGPAVIEPKNTLADISKAKRMLGWETKIDFEKGLEITYNYFTAIQ